MWHAHMVTHLNGNPPLNMHTPGTPNTDLMTAAYALYIVFKHIYIYIVVSWGLSIGSLGWLR